MTNILTGDKTPQKDKTKIVYRHPLAVRLFHWINVVCFITLLMSGLQIFNQYPRLHWGHTGYHAMPAWLEITGIPDMTHEESWIQIGEFRIDTSGFLGQAYDASAKGYGIVNMAFPTWMTLPSAAFDLHNGRGWHILMMWVFVINIGWYFIYGLGSRRFWRELWPDKDQLHPRAIAKDLWMHLRFKHHQGEEALRYNLLQRLTYIVVLFGLLPAIVLSGMTMSHSALAAYPWLVDLFGGRQTARTLHFLFANLLVIFVIVHLIQVVVAGFVNEMRSIITGYFHIPGRGEK